MKKNPHFEASRLYNNDPKAFINHKELSPIHKLGLKLAKNNIATQDVYAVVYQNFDSDKKVLVDVVVGKSRQMATVEFFNNPQHQFQLNHIRAHIEPSRDDRFTHSEGHMHYFHTIKLYRLNYKNPTVEWNTYGTHFDRLWENTMMTAPTH